ncbi:hypothetical protein HQ393_05065 [Chitinibacter bivalviorum]|uniref:DUF1508 domain-containing protein n=1 Tax=Chitinibacter bivalviorum TaxID=2739434 RepID=A0A7H9BGG1_9NEIS|nr:hypothetical protein [Chitinibacter bivalviorum]QLG87675.1 hypothetical protein HQ393_05065 [Chitinibacter bivalviorum]
MSTTSYEYKGHTIQINTSERKGSWNWDFTIDGTHYSESRERPLQNEQIILDEGKTAAERVVDRMVA